MLIPVRHARARKPKRWLRRVRGIDRHEAEHQSAYRGAADAMSDKFDWTQQLGDAFLAQQRDVLNAVQKLRAEAQAAGNLQSTPQRVVTTEPTPVGVNASGGQPAIVIEPVNPDVYSVPVFIARPALRRAYLIARCRGPPMFRALPGSTMA